MKRRGELSMEVIIIAAIALLILVILSVLIIRSGGKLSTDCANSGGVCGTKGSCESGTIETPNSGGCPGGSEAVCCISLGKKE